MAAVIECVIDESNYVCSAHYARDNVEPVYSEEERDKKYMKTAT